MNDSAKNWNIKYLCLAALLALIWFAAYFCSEPFSQWFTAMLGLVPSSRLGAGLQFFIYDTLKIFLLLAALIYVMALLRAALNVERVRDYLMGKRKSAGYLLGALFGSITPFCSCSSIPLFLGFTAARIPFGITMAFLITSPLINEMAVILLWGLLGWKFTIIYLCAGMTAGILGGFFMDAIRAERWLQPFFLEIIHNPPENIVLNQRKELSLQERHNFAWAETSAIFRRVWKWVLLGVAIGAALHGFVPDDWFARHFSAREWWTVPCAVFVAIPLYTNVTGILPVMESLLLKGLPIGTTLAFCMSAVAASLPEIMLLRQIMTIKLQAVFLAFLWLIFTLSGWLFNFAQPYL